jgi:hypothetical protein
MNIGATVMITPSTTGDPSLQGGLRRKEERTRDPPSIITDRRPSLRSMSGIVSGAIRPARQLL